MMVKGIAKYLLAAAVLSGLVYSCSTQRNTSLSRNHHALTTRYNVKFNAEQSFLKGLDQIEKSYKADYSDLLPVFIISDPAMQKVASGNMKACIDKCQKAIKTHSIRVKPDKKPARNAPEKERRFYEQEEFNPVMPSVFLLMAKAELYGGDFESAVSTCSYIQQHFSHDKKTCDASKIYQAIAYYIDDWLYEAENIFVKMNDEGFDSSLNALYSTAYGDLLLHQGRTQEAIPLIEIGLSNTHRKVEKQRYTYLLAQLYQSVGQDDKSYSYYKKVTNLSPSYEMDLNARIHQTEVNHHISQKAVVRKLLRMSRNKNNADYLDAIHYAIGNYYLNDKDTVQAIEQYKTAIAKSTLGGHYKAQSLITLGGLYYDDENFRPAVPCYKEGNPLIEDDNSIKEMVAERDRILQILEPYVETIFVQDSLQAMAALPEERRSAIIDSIIEVVKKQLKEEARKKSQEEALSANEEFTKENVKESDEPKATVSNGDNSWYFYNEASLKQGKKDFEKNWGKRSLEDNWRIRNKGTFFSDLNASLNGTDETPPADGTTTAPDGLLTDIEAESTATDAPEFEASDDPTEPGYYLKDLPFTEEQIAESNAQIAEAMFNAAKVYREQMENDDLALRTFAELERRFPADTLWLPETYYLCYLILMQHHENEKAEDNRHKLLTNHPNTEQAEILSDSLFIQKMIDMYAHEDSMYNETYRHFISNHADSVKANYSYVEANYSRSTLMPKFMFLRAMEAVKDGDGELFLRLITEITAKYPNCDLKDMVSQMLAYWNAGLRPQGFNGFYEGYVDIDSLMLDSISNQFTYQPKEPHLMVLSYPSDSTNANHLLFDVALYNFTNFLIRDYELSLEQLAKHDVLVIRPFENAEDVTRYASWMNFQTERPEEKYPGLVILIISESNFKLLNTTTFGDNITPIEAYIRFYRKHYLGEEIE